MVYFAHRPAFFHLEFRRASPNDVGKLARKLSAETLRTWLHDPKTSRHEASLYSLLLSYCGEAEDADEISKWLEKEADQKPVTNRERADMLVGMVSLKPECFSPKLRAMAKDKKLSLFVRYEAMLAVRYLHDHRLDLQAKVNTFAMMADFLELRDLADLAIEDLRQWKRWEFTDRVLCIYDLKSHDTAIIQRAILRFALQAPGPAAAAFVAKMRKKDADWVETTKELLDLGQQISK